MNGYPSFYPTIALVAPSPGDIANTEARDDIENAYSWANTQFKRNVLV